MTGEINAKFDPYLLPQSGPGFVFVVSYLLVMGWIPTCITEILHFIEKVHKINNRICINIYSPCFKACRRSICSIPHKQDPVMFRSFTHMKNLFTKTKRNTALLSSFELDNNRIPFHSESWKGCPVDRRDARICTLHTKSK